MVKNLTENRKLFSLIKVLLLSTWIQVNGVNKVIICILIAAYYGLLRPLDQIAPYRLEMGIFINYWKVIKPCMNFGEKLPKT